MILLLTLILAPIMLCVGCSLVCEWTQTGKFSLLFCGFIGMLTVVLMLFMSICKILNIMLEALK